MEETPSIEANRFSASQEIPRILCCPKCHYRIYKCPSPVPIVSQLVSFHAPRSHFLSIHFTISLPSKHLSSYWSKWHQRVQNNQNPRRDIISCFKGRYDAVQPDGWLPTVQQSVLRSKLCFSPEDGGGMLLRITDNNTLAYTKFSLSRISKKETHFLIISHNVFQCTVIWI